VGAELFQADGQTDMQQIVAFRKFCELALSTRVKSVAPLPPLNLHGVLLNSAMGQLWSCLSCGQQPAHNEVDSALCL
jgi:hypothetical protein